MSFQSWLFACVPGTRWVWDPFNQFEWDWERFLVNCTDASDSSYVPTNASWWPVCVCKYSAFVWIIFILSFDYALISR